ncbi:hypothetical protein ACA910_017093 [Epithemia clementina (nom. ined.)]
MVAASDYAFRCLCRQYGVDLTFTQMLHVRPTCDDSTHRMISFDFFEFASAVAGRENLSPKLVEYQQTFLDGLDADKLQLPKQWESYRSGPLIVQLAGDSVDHAVQAAHLILEDTPNLIGGIDLNCGCPQTIARKGNYGAFLMEDDNGERACEILSALRQALPRHVTVSAKIRLPLDPCLLETRIRRLVRTEIDFFTIHGRTLWEKKYGVREVHLDEMQRAVEIAQSERSDFPVVANGGVERFADVEHVRRETGTVAVMSSEALLETPNVFLPSATDLNHPRQLLEQQFQFAREYLQWAALYPPRAGVQGVEGSFQVVCGHLFRFLHRYWQENKDLQHRLANLMETNRLVHAYDFVDELYHRYSSRDGFGDEMLLQVQSLRRNASWYRRHWDRHSRRDASKLKIEAITPPKLCQTLSLADKKDVMKERIAMLRAQREAKEKLRMDATTTPKLCQKLSLPDQKDIIKERIAILRAQREAKKGSLVFASKASII